MLKRSHSTKLLSCPQPKEKAMNSRFKRFQRQSWLIGSLALLMGLGWSKAVRAEGSVDLINDGGFRPFLEFRNDATATILRRSIIKVYAQTGETINLGSSATGIGAGTINYRAPDGTAGTCGAGVGQIPNLAAEVAGSGAGYIPCTITVGANQTGVWEIDFVSPDPTSQADPTPIPVITDWAPQPPNVGYVAAWDVTVRNAGGAAIPGRAYANYLALNMGSNGVTLNSNTFIQTDIGYLYQIDLKGLDPFGFIFFSNSKGFTDLPCPGGTPLYTSVPLAPAPFFCIPANADNPATGDITYKIFFNPPSATLPSSAPVAGGGTTWLRNPPPPPPDASDFSFNFQGIQGTPNQAGPTLGGNFLFNSTSVGYYAIVIDVNRDDVLGNANDVVLQGPAVIGLNTIAWNGTDANGVPLPAGTTPYNSTLSFFVGDIHFPFLDPENNPGGLTIQRVNPNSLAVEDSIVYYNDSLLPPVGVPPDPISALGGIDSTPGVHRFDGNFGNDNGIDTWTSLVEPISLTGGILIQEADLSINKTDTSDPVVAGGPISYNITVTSNPPTSGETYTDVTGAQVVDTVPPEITGVTWTCAITSGTGACGTASGTGNNIDLTVDLSVGASATITVNGTVSPTASGTLNNTATVNRPPDVFDPNLDNNTEPEDTTITPGPVQPVGTKSVRLFTDTDGSSSLTTGDIVEYTITYSNNNPSLEITNFLVTDSLDPNVLSFVSGSYSFSASGTGTTVTANPNYNGTTDTNLNTIGTLGAGGGQMVVKFQAVVTAGAGVEIRNQAIATSNNGTVNPSITDAFSAPTDIPQVVDDTVEQGNLPATGDDEPTLLVVGSGSGSGPPRLLLVKRITNVTRNGVPISGVNFNSFVDDPNTNDDNAAGWSQLPGGGPVGLFNLESQATLQSGDEVEYTVYFLSDGSQPVTNAQFCDPIPQGTTFIADTYGPGSGILLNRDATQSPQTNASDTDQGTFSSPLTPVTTPCPDTNNPNGSVLSQVGNVPNTPPNNVGFVRFRVTIN